MVHLDRHYVDERLVALYDIENARGDDTDFYLGLAAALDARTILDLGCGTGLLTRELAVEGRRVIGVDPAPAMLAVARRGGGCRAGPLGRGGRRGAGDARGRSAGDDRQRGPGLPR